MPRLANERHELYCFHRAKGMIPKKAMIAAGFAQGSSTYAQLEENPEINARILELTHDIQLRREQQRAAAMKAAELVGTVTGVSKAWVIQRLAEVAISAKEDQDYKSANEALTLIGKEYGMFTGGSALKDPDDEGGGGQTIDMDMTRGLLDAAENAMTVPEAPEAEPRPEVDMAAVERLISGNKPVRAKDRQLTTGSETDVAMKPDAMTDEE